MLVSVWLSLWWCLFDCPCDDFFMCFSLIVPVMMFIVFQSDCPCDGVCCVFQSDCPCDDACCVFPSEDLDQPCEDVCGVFQSYYPSVMIFVACCRLCNVPEWWCLLSVSDIWLLSDDICVMLQTPTATQSTLDRTGQTTLRTSCSVKTPSWASSLRAP